MHFLLDDSSFAIVFDPNQPSVFVKSKGQKLTDWNPDGGVSFNINDTTGCLEVTANLRVIVIGG